MLGRLAIILLLCPMVAAAQGFAGLGRDLDGFAEVTPDRKLSFPADHAPHPDYRIEWWYLTANLTDANGADYGVQFTLFRQAAAPPPQRAGWASQQYWLGHAALTTAETHLYTEKRARGGVGQAGATAAPFSAWIDDWALAAEPGADGLSKLRLTAGSDDFSYELTLSATGPLALQGRDGFSVKSDRGQASYYYSQPHFQAEGRLRLGEADVAVSGRAWMDREWSSQPLAADQKGWDWLSLHLADGRKIMAFRLRSDQGEPYHSANLIDGETSTAIGAGDIRFIPLAEADVAGRRVPVAWRLSIPAHGVEEEVEAINPAAWNGGGIGYWEGPVRGRAPSTAIGYLELTGY